MMLATYRLQLTKEFTLAHAREVVPFLHALGVTHLYLSPVLQARRGSAHGYDVADPTVVNAELGGEEALRALADAARALGMGILLDVVPNHMGIGPENRFWEEVLAHGEHSRYARWFDVDWEAHPKRKLVLPVLGDELTAVLARGEIGLDISEKEGIRLTYFGHSFPLDPATLPEELQLVQFDPNARDAALAWIAGDEGRARLRALLDRQHYALTFWRSAPRGINYRRFFDVNELAALRVEDPAVFDETHALVLRLVEEGVIDGLRVDHVDGLRDPLGYLRRLRQEVEARAGGRAGDRVLGPGERHGNNPAPSTQHPAVRSSAFDTDNAVSNAFPIVVEKILSPGETLRTDWPVHGTTGYEFMNDVETLFVSADGARRVEGAYRRMRRLPQQSRPTEFEDVAREGKLLVLRGPLRADMLRLARRLATTVLVESEEAIEATALPRWTRRDIDELADGLTQLVASLPVYRTYIDGRTALPHEEDRVVIERAVARAQEQVDPEEHAVVVRVARAFLEPMPERGRARDSRLDFILRFQQTSGPATAKGVEDTALYRYVPLASRNEVGGEPDRPLHDAVERMHAVNAERATRWPASLLATNTHDTKRSADVRTRIDVLSELPDEWLRSVNRWRRLNRRHRTVVRGRLLPDTNTEWLFYQTLVGIWPAPRTGRRADDLPSAQWLEQAATRLRDYMMKAVKEAKVLTSWTDPDTEYEETLQRFIEAVLDPKADSPFLGDVARFVARVARPGMWNSLARVLVHCTAPGVPDTYQGDECWAHTLVDPDNRRPVDFARRAAMLAELERIFPPELPAPDAALRLRDFLRAPEDERLKLLVLWRALQARGRAPGLFATGGYEPLTPRGPLAGHLFAFARTHPSAGSGQTGPSAIAAVPRLQVPLGMVGHAGAVPAERWEGTTLALPESLTRQRWRSAFTGREVAASNDALELRPLFEEFPLLLLLPA
jgi:(1->4)-alpha-D-glucan 1-alpha-D-glucosylmutase